MISGSDASVRPIFVALQRHVLIASATVIGLVSLALYFPSRQHALYHEDSVGFAFAIHSFNLAAHQPQSPGYPLYVATLRVVERLTGLSDNDTMVLVSMGATVLAVVLFYLLARSWLGVGARPGFYQRSYCRVRSSGSMPISL
ncbi:MAG: hypothetical protein ACRDIY_11160 [Chloroflexota bacterium]